MKKILIVRLGALGDLVHTVPAVAALRAAFPEARLDWIVDARYRAILDLVPVVDRRIAIGGPGWPGLAFTIGALRAERYDAAFDFQGLIKSAALARSSGARRVIGFSWRQLRERAARAFYSDAVEPRAAGPHVIHKNLALLEAVGVRDGEVRFPLERPRPTIAREALGLGPGERFVILNPGAAWPNKRWPPSLFGALAAAIRHRFQLPSIVLWGPGEQSLAEEAVSASRGASAKAPATTLGDVLNLCAEATLVVSGDTAALHLAAAVATPVVGLFGPTSPARNGPWAAADVSISRFESCVCHHQRRCRRERDCIRDITIEDVMDGVARRLSHLHRHV